MYNYTCIYYILYCILIICHILCIHCIDHSLETGSRSFSNIKNGFRPSLISLIFGGLLLLEEYAIIIVDVRVANVALKREEYELGVCVLTIVLR